MRKPARLTGLGLLLAGLAAAPDDRDRRPHTSSPAPAPGGVDHDKTLRRYCGRCHGARRQEAGLSLADFSVADATSQAEVAEKVIHKLRSGLMPPPGRRRPEPEVLAGLLTDLEATLDGPALRNPDPGSRGFQRMNRAEYARAVEDLLGLQVDPAAWLPPDTYSDGFDNIADAQHLSATLLQGYLRAADAISRAAVGDPEASPQEATYKLPRTASQLEHAPGTPFGTRGGMAVNHSFAADGDYVFKINLHSGPTGFLYGMTARDERVEVSLDGERVALLDIDRWMSESDPQGMVLETEPIPVRAGSHTVAAAFLPQGDGPVDDLIAPIEHSLADTMIGAAYGVTTVPHLRRLVIGGPFGVTGVSESASRRRIFTSRPLAPEEEIPCATEILSRLATRAYRRPLEAADLSGLLKFYQQGAAEGGFENGIRTALQAILSSPHFVFRLERIPEGVAPGAVYPLPDVELASRLSFFLWASPPDDELLRVARSGTLQEDAVLSAQVERMLDDPRAEALASRFASQWLRLQDLDKVHPDALSYPHFDHTLAEAMKRETELFFTHLVQADRSALEILSADYSFVDERLARHYGIAGVSGDEFVRVDLPAERRGVLGHGSVLTLTSHANRSSPVLRGKWVMEVLLGSPPPPPPPDVPELEETAAVEDGRLLTVRERLAQHRENPSCNSCHRVIDPIGLALEHFDVTGAWRIKDQGAPIDASGELFDGTELEGAADLREGLLKRPEALVRTLLANLSRYAIGRRTEAFDMPHLRAIERETAADGYPMRALIQGIVHSPAFRMARAEGER